MRPKDRQKQIQMLLKSRKRYANQRPSYYTRKKLPSFVSKPSNHTLAARRIYQVNEKMAIAPNPKLAKLTGCSVDALSKIVRKGEGAYYSSGSRPNQTAQSWGLARLASAITGQKAAAVDYDILDKGCRHDGRAFQMAKKARAKFGHGHNHTKRIVVASR